MSEKPPPIEGWNISSRRVLAVMVAILAVLALALTLSQHRYRATIEPTTHPRVDRFPDPQLDGFDNPTRSAPARRADQSRPLGDAALIAAAAHGGALLQDAPK